MIRRRGSVVLFAVLESALPGVDGKGEPPGGEPRWPSLGGGFMMTVHKTGTIYAASDDDVLYVVAADGSELSRLETGGWPVHPMIAADGLLIVADSGDYSFLKQSPKN